MRSLSRLVWIVLVWCLLAIPVAAQGLAPDPPPHEIMPLPDGPVRLASHRVVVEVNDQIASTRVEQVFVNEASYPVEGTYLFALPAGAVVSDFAMWVDGKRLEGKLLTREQARAIYEAIVRRQRDPALLEYIGRDLFQARIFPIPPGGQRKIELSYEQVLPREGTLVHYRYPLRTEGLNARPVDEVSISIALRTSNPLKAIYSPSHDVAIVRDGEQHARVGFEASQWRASQDFDLYFSTAEQAIDLSILSYRPAGEDGFFLLLAAPPLANVAETVVAKDVILVLDTSGSMKGEKIRQAQDALVYILDQLGPRDRFNVVAFSTGVRTYARDLAPAEKAPAAKEWVRTLRAVGGTDINRALLEAVAALPDDSSRPAIILFLTDGLPTEGETDEARIVENFGQVAGKHVRLFPFGVGDDVNTVLLDQLAENYRGSSAYVRPGQRIDEVVSGFYARISQPVLTDLALDFGDLHVEEVYPRPLPDLFAGSQLLVTGRYRRGGTTDVQLRGLVDGRPITYTYEALTFREEGGEPFIARLWATRKIGYLLTQIRLHGASQELVDEVIDLSQRYGIATPYTSYLVEEPGAVRPLVPLRLPTPIPRWERGGAGIGGGAEGGAPAAAPMAQEQAADALSDLAQAPVSGAGAVEESILRREMKEAQQAGESAAGVRVVNDKTFVWRDGVWVDRAFDPARMTTRRVVFGSDDYFALLSQKPALAPYFALGTRVIVVLDGQAYESVEAP